MLEGVIKFDMVHREEPLGAEGDAKQLGELQAWRQRLRERGLVGADPSRYEGLGFGNLSVRLGPGAHFLITGSQTGAVETLGPDHCCVVIGVDVGANRLHSRGPCLPSSESLSHAQIYTAWPECRAVFHAHSPELWGARSVLALPCSPAEVAYGTQAMARALDELLLGIDQRDGAVLAMEGHEDGILAIASSADGAGRALLAALDRALDIPLSS